MKYGASRDSRGRRNREVAWSPLDRRQLAPASGLTKNILQNENVFAPKSERPRTAPLGRQVQEPLKVPSKFLPYVTGPLPVVPACLDKPAIPLGTSCMHE